jgi:hypothetical protein
LQTELFNFLKKTLVIITIESIIICSDGISNGVVEIGNGLGMPDRLESFDLGRDGRSLLE